jgi:hypothetical protein
MQVKQRILTPIGLTNGQLNKLTVVLRLIQSIIDICTSKASEMKLFLLQQN